MRATTTETSKETTWPWYITGVMLTAFAVTLALISPDFDYEMSLKDMPIPWLTIVIGIAGVAYLVLFPLSIKGVLSPRLIVFIFACGLFMRVAMFLSTPMLEDDYYRYLWDGAVTATGQSPYRYSPEQVTQAIDGDGAVTADLYELGLEAGETIRRVNHPWLKTIYPPTAQAAFAISYFIEPFSMNGWRATLLLLDFTTLILLVLLVREVALPVSLIALYWLNPLLVKEIYNSGHMDMIIFPFLVASLLATIRKNPILASVMLALAAGAKVWPVFILPLIMRPFIRERDKLIASTAVFVSICLLMFLPVYLGGLGETSGFNAYGERWEMNDALFMLILWGVKFIAGAAGAASETAEILTRGFVFCIISAVALGVAIRSAKDGPGLIDKALWIAAAIFLFSPTQFPWYYMWMLPLLAVRPRFSLLLLTALLPIYYLRFYFKAIGKVDIFDYWIVWIEFVPVWVLIGREFYVRRLSRLSVEPTEVSQ